jgi:aminomethyltransferase
MKAGEEFNIKPTGPSDIRRIEGAIFNWGADMTYDNNPIEMGLDRLVDWDSLTEDTCISLAALMKIRDAGVGRKIVGVEMDGEPFEALNNVKWPVTADGAEIGKVTSAIYSPRLEKNIGYAWVPTQYANHGTSLGVSTEWGDRNAVVVEMPFVDPKKQIPLA